MHVARATFFVHEGGLPKGHKSPIFIIFNWALINVSQSDNLKETQPVRNRDCLRMVIRAELVEDRGDMKTDSALPDE